MGDHDPDPVPDPDTSPDSDSDSDPDPVSVPVTVYTREDCRLCDAAIRDIGHASTDADVPVTITEINIDRDNRNLADEYGSRVPCVFLDGELIYEHRVDTYDLRRRLDGFSGRESV
jgi:Glutaredoxin-like domain (DUF836).